MSKSLYLLTHAKVLMNMIFATLVLVSATLAMGCSTGNEVVASSASASANESSAQEADRTVSVGGMSIIVPGSWQVADADKGKYIYPDFGGLFYVISSTIGLATDEAAVVVDFVKGIMDGGDVQAGEPKVMTVNSGSIYRFDASGNFEIGELSGTIDVAIRGDTLYAIMAMVPDSCTSAERFLVDGILDNAKYPDAPSVPEDTGAGEAAAVQETVSQQNAVRTARQYLNTMGFSFTGLVGQLEYEGYSRDDAVYGASNCGADWNAQAAKSAQQYLKAMAFSHDGLVEQLMYDGYTQEQAEYGVSTVGL